MRSEGPISFCHGRFLKNLELWSCSLLFSKSGLHMKDVDMPTVKGDGRMQDWPTKDLIPILTKFI